MSTSQQADPLIGRLVDGRYRVRARIARGGMATVYVATDLRLERRVALKVMHGHLSDDSVFQSRFIQEARSAARLADPHVVNVFDQGQDGETAYLVMEYLPGITLRELMREQRRLTIAQTVTIMDAVLSGLAAAHRGGIIHRDVKPENVLLAEDGRIKIGDFGLARATTANTATGQMLLGTIAYLAPELVTRGTADARSDIYALGILLYEMLVGEQPYQGEQPMQIAFQHATDSVPRPSVKNPGVPEQLDELVLWATERSPDDRPSDATEMLGRLREIEHELGIYPQVARAVAAAGPATDDGVDSGPFDSMGVTSVLPSTMTAPTTAVDTTDNATRLRRSTRRRSVKGGWIFVVVILLAALAGGIGWWFGSGPGSMVAVPTVAGMTFDAAQAEIANAGMIAQQRPVYSLDVAAGLAVGTDPEPGTRLDRDTSVAVLISQGPQPQTVPSLSGMSADLARQTLTALNIRVTDPNESSFTEAAAGSVIGASVTQRGDGSVIDCTAGCSIHEGDTASLAVSLGPVPDVTGQSPDTATGILNGVNLQVSSDKPTEFSDDIAAGDVIRIAGRDGGGDWRPGETVTLIVSKGPEPIAVPAVVGLTIRDAIKKLEAAGLKGRTDIPDTLGLWDIYRVKGVTPKEGTLQPPGTAITFTDVGL
ncbi:Stk1 family PASTA domain-containing Ser/Thr kinase [Microbacterium rhizomatis]|uniref:non-specific serine/threonine protein kinase n=1 Tax=Microbacterium rhizomatis TaxID=1631477 RepID=A0A5J5J7H1_9MICO|nr:Stk1 family PASTA domain-containing Ser/Thr kinase [Microbacterium rhizomatis]KAA9110935.1 Stk1 family PASTA domain-containing Ser/Thr kinase [Microbacterium rhizomatis]